MKGSHNLFENCKLRNAGTDAVDITGLNNGLNHCEIYNVGSNGVKMSGGNRASLTPGNNYVKNCKIYNFSRWEMTYREALEIRGCGNIVSHNVIHDAPHAAIMFYGNEHLIEYNEIFDVCKMTSDAGAIYTGRNWGYRGNIIRYNFIHHLLGLNRDSDIKGVFLDDVVSGITVFGNIFYEINGYASSNGGGRDNHFINNIFVKCQYAHKTDRRAMEKVNNEPGDSWNLLERLAKDNIQYREEPWKSRYPELAVIPND